jgi:glutathione S-transferase
MLIVYGTTTSPYVRRVRVVAHELGLAHELVDTMTDEGQAELRERTPIWKVPAAEIDGELVFDSRVICDVLVARHGAGKLASVASVADRNLITVVDGALDSLINCFYLARDGVDTQSVAYLRKQRERATSALSWVEAQIGAGWGAPDRFALPEIALATAAGWMRFRETYPIDQHPGLVARVERCEARESFVATRPAAPQVATR